MGSFASRLTSPAAPKRKYPQRVPSQSPRAAPPPSSSFSSPAPSPNLQARASSPEAADASFAKSLRALGPVTPSNPFTAPPQQPQPSSHPSSTVHSNPALEILAARTRLAGEAEGEFALAARAEGARRRFVDVETLRRALALRDGQGVAGEEIERRLGLERGVVGMLGRRGVVGVVGRGD